MTTIDDHVTVRRCTAGDVPSVLALLQASLGWLPDARHADFFTWKHEENPFGRSPAWVAAEGEGRVVGFRTFMRWEFLRDSRVVPAVRAVDTATHPDYQGRGLFSRLTRSAIAALRAEGVAFVFNTPNQRSLPGYLKMGWQTVGRLPVSARASSLRAWGRLIRARAPAEKWSLPPESGVPATEVFAEASAVERLLAALPEPVGLRTRRTAPYLRWRYGFPSLEYRVAYAGGTLEEGAAVYRLRRRGTATEAAICEVLAPSADRKLGADLYRRVIAASGADYALRVDGPPFSHGFLPLPRQGPIMTWRALADTAMPDRRDWKLSLGDVELF